MAKPYQYQRAGASAIESFDGRALLADEMGMGKSIQALLYAHRNPEHRPMVIVCPASLKWHWDRESLVHFNMRSDVLEGMKPHRKGVAATSQILIINYDILHKWVPYLRSLNPKLIVIDEGHNIASRKTLRSKAVRRLCRGVERVVILTGTPLINRVAELWNLLNLLRPELFPSFWDFANEYSRPELKPWGWVFTGARRLKQLHQVLCDTVMIRRLKEDVLTELPAKQRIVLPLPIQDRKQYVRAELDFLGWLREQSPGKVRSAAKSLGLVKIGYLKRLAAKLKLRSVIEWVDDFLADTEGKLVLFALHKTIIGELRERYKHQCVVVDGSVTGRDRQLAVDQFQRKARTRLFIGNIKAAGVGITLTAANTVAFAEMGWTPGEHTQAEDRIHRIGQSKVATCYYLVARGTVEEKLCKLIQEKQAVLQETLDGTVDDSFDLYDQLLEELLK